MKVYLDVCCLNRPIDDRSQERIRSEAEAVEQVLIKIEAGVCDMVASDALDKEIALNPDPDKRLLVQRILASAVARVSVDEEVAARAQALTGLGFGTNDALHLACAEAIAADALLTTDDRLLRRASRYHRQVKVRVLNPLQWLKEFAS
jgi:predicted nucleic acid-binding protein